MLTPTQNNTENPSIILSYEKSDEPNPLSSDFSPPYADAFANGLRPPEKLKPSEWADKYRVLPKESSAEPGKFRMSRTPYMRVPLDCLDPLSSVQIVTIKKPTQVGCTDGIGNNFLFYIADHSPGPSMMMLPTIDLARRHSKSKIAPSLKAMSRMKDIVKDRKSKDGGNEILIKEFPGGSWMFVGSNSASALRSVSVRFLVLDDTDGYEQDVKGEGDPAELARKRTDSFSAISKELRMSTPTLKEFSKIEKYFDEGDQSYYHVPCPFCNHKQTLEFGGPDADYGLKFSRNKSGKVIPNTVGYMCAECHEIIPEHYKTKMLAEGEWIATYPELSDHHRSFALNSLYSPMGWVSWLKIIQEFLEAKKDPTRTKYKVWLNTRMGESYEDPGERPEWVGLKARSEPYKILSIPDPVRFLTAGVDVQNDRFAILILGWARGEECFVIYWGELFANTESPNGWKELDEFLSRSFTHSSGVSMHIATRAIDSGHRTHEVYNYARTHSDNTIAIKGSSLKAQPILGRPSTKDVNYKGATIKNGVQLWPIGTDTAKATIYSRLKILDSGPRMIHFPIGLTDDFYRQLTSERQITKYNKSGKPYKEWILPSGMRNEALDVFVYALAAAIRSGIERMNWDDIDAIMNYKSSQIAKPNVNSSDSPTPPTPLKGYRPRRIHSPYLNRVGAHI